MINGDRLEQIPERPGHDRCGCRAMHSKYDEVYISHLQTVYHQWGIVTKHALFLPFNVVTSLLEKLPRKPTFV
jgi:hypothetical protein